MNNNQTLNPTHCVSSWTVSQENQDLIKVNSEKLQVLEMLLAAFVDMTRIKAQSPGECSHMLANHTAWLQRQIGLMLKAMR